MRAILLGPPGAGKGTLAEAVGDSAAHISTGDILRANVKAGTPLGVEAKKFMDSGALAPDGVIIGMMRGRLAEDDARRGFLLDGYPRTVPQAEALDALLREMGITLDAAVLLDIDDETVTRRMTSRIVCSKCGAIYNSIAKPPRTPGVCDACGGEVARRADDREESIRHRLEVYHAQTAPLIDYYEASGLLRRIDASDAREAKKKFLSLGQRSAL
jgi:adenylate kinase